MNSFLNLGSLRITYKKVSGVNKMSGAFASPGALAMSNGLF